MVKDLYLQFEIDMIKNPRDPPGIPQVAARKVAERKEISLEYMVLDLTSLSSIKMVFKKPKEKILILFLQDTRKY